MRHIIYNESRELDLSPFTALVGSDIMSFIVENAPGKVITRVGRALEHYVRSEKLIGIDEEMGAIRLITAEEELVVAIFEWLKLNQDSFPEHKDFTRKFKNHVVKLAFYPVLLQFRFIFADMLRDGITIQGLEGVLNWTARPVLNGKQIELAIYGNNGEELIRNNPFWIDISMGDVRGKPSCLTFLMILNKLSENSMARR